MDHSQGLAPTPQTEDTLGHAKACTDALPSGAPSRHADLFTIHKWPHKVAPTEATVRQEMEHFGFEVYDLQTIPGWFERSLHAHDYDEIRGAVSGVTTFHFAGISVTLEPGDILVVKGGVPHAVRSHNGSPFTGFKGSRSGKRSVTELGDGKGSLEDLARQDK